MSEIFVPIPSQLDAIRFVPKWGAWCMLGGNPLAMARGSGLPGFCERLGLRRMDIVWVYNELMPASYLKKESYYRRGTHSEREGWWEDEALEGKTRDELLDALEEHAHELFGHVPSQATIMQAHVPSDEVVRFWVGELRRLSERTLEIIKEESAYTLTPFGVGGTIPITALPALDEALRDIVGSLQLDGLSYAAAAEEAMKMGEFTPEQAGALEQHVAQAHPLPGYYWKASDAVYYTFND